MWRQYRRQDFLRSGAIPLIALRIGLNNGRLVRGMEVQTQVGYHLPARYLKPAQFKPGVKFRRPSGERRTRPGGFIVPGRSLTNIGPAGRAAERSFVFERTGKDRLPIRQIGVRIERLVLLAFVRAARQVIPGAEREFVKRFEFRAQRAADKYLRRRRDSVPA